MRGANDGNQDCVLLLPRLAIYFTKHSSPNMNGDKEYQNVVPELWRRPGRGPGQFWGVLGLKKAVAVVEVAQDAYLAARRLMRRWSRSQAAYGDSGSRFPAAVLPRTVIRLVPRVNRDTGAVIYRRVRRRRTLCNQGGLAGGYALVNDFPAFASQLAAALLPDTWGGRRRHRNVWRWGVAQRDTTLIIWVNDSRTTSSPPRRATTQRLRRLGCRTGGSGKRDQRTDFAARRSQVSMGAVRIWTWRYRGP